MENPLKNEAAVKINFTPYLIPLAIIVTCGLIAATILFTDNVFGRKNAVTKIAPATLSDKQKSDTTSEIRSVTVDDHLKGDLNAPVKIVVYSDFECPFCQRFHNTMNELMLKYGAGREVVWVFRQFPLEQLHPVKAQAVAVASECAGELAGNEGFWQFSDRYFELTLTNNRTDIGIVIPQIVKEMGINSEAFLLCTKSGRHDAKILADIADATKTGGRGTPWSVVIAPNGKTFPLNGAQSLTAIEQLISIAQKEKVQ
jgi:protein-disulfide isomerase